MGHTSTASGYGANTGSSGSVGPQGPQGIQGPPGDTGPQGPAGATGPQGPQGVAGADGAQGIQGIQGPAGNNGADGAQGPAGADGAAGQGVPTGGATGQVLAKTSGTDYATGWVTPSAAPTIAFKTADQTNVGTSYVDVTEVGLSVAANKAYAFEFVLICDADAATTGIDVACNGPASPTSICYEVCYWTSATARTERCATAYDLNTGSTGSNGTAQKLFRVRGVLRNGANSGTLIARAKREAVGSGPNVRAGSYGVLTPLN